MTKKRFDSNIVSLDEWRKRKLDLVRIDGKIQVVESLRVEAPEEATDASAPQRIENV